MSVTKYPVLKSVRAPAGRASRGGGGLFRAGRETEEGLVVMKGVSFLLWQYVRTLEERRALELDWTGLGWARSRTLGCGAGLGSEKARLGGTTWEIGGSGWQVKSVEQRSFTRAPSEAGSRPPSRKTEVVRRYSTQGTLAGDKKKNEEKSEGFPHASIDQRDARRRQRHHPSGDRGGRGTDSDR